MRTNIKNTYDINSSVQYIADTLIINGTIIDCSGLLYGKMGIAIFFMHYFRHTGITVYENYAADLIKEIQNQIHADMSIGYERGLSGIGAGIEYLAQNGFLDESTDEILADIDNKITTSIKYMCDNHYEPRCEITEKTAKEMSGAGLYLLWRISNPESGKKADILKSILKQVIDFIPPEYSDFNIYNNLISKTHKLNLYREKTTVLIKEFKKPVSRKSYKYITSLFTDSQNKFIHHINEGGKISHAYSKFNTEHEMGLIGGMAGIGLYLLSCHYNENTWYSLL